MYDGGALALYALRQKVGAKRFNALERRWVAKYRGRSASTDDFIRLASRVAHKDLRTFLIAWLYGTRTPPMPGHPDWTVDPVPRSGIVEDAELVALRVDQVDSPHVALTAAAGLTRRSRAC